MKSITLFAQTNTKKTTDTQPSAFLNLSFSERVDGVWRKDESPEATGISLACFTNSRKDGSKYQSANVNFCKSDLQFLIGYLTDMIEDAPVERYNGSSEDTPF